MYKIGYAIEDAWCWLKSWLSLLAGVAVLMVVVVLILGWATSAALENNAHNAALDTCFAHGYPEVRRASLDSPWYCVRRVDGTDEVTSLCDLYMYDCEGSE